MKSRTLCVAAAFLVSAWMASASSLHVSTDPSGLPSGRADLIDSAADPSPDPSTGLEATVAARETFPRAIRPGSYLAAALAELLRPRLAFGNRSARGPPVVA